MIFNIREVVAFAESTLTKMIRHSLAKQDLCQVRTLIEREVSDRGRVPEFDDSERIAAMDEADIAVMTRLNGRAKKVGIFSLHSKSADVRAGLPDGDYVNLVDGAAVRVQDGMLRCEGKPVIISLPL